MTDYYDSLETRNPDQREAEQLTALREQVAHAKAKTRGYGQRLADVDPASLTSLSSLASLPVTRKSDLLSLQSADNPFGGFNAVEPGRAGRIFVSPGPIYELEAVESDYQRAGRALFAAGFRPGDMVYNTFAYHLTPGGWIMDAAARANGCAVVPAGIGNTEQQIAALAHLRPQGYAGTPDFLKILLDKGIEAGLDLSSISKALVSGGALFPSLRAEYAERGVQVLQCYATAELGLVGYETADADGTALEGMILDEGVIVEIVRPGTGDPVADGEVGEVVVTTFNPAYPLIRFATGDLSAVLTGSSACGRTNRRIKGWMGRADQTTKIKGMFVHPEQVADIVARHPEVTKARLIAERQGENDAMRLQVEVTSQAEGLENAVAESLQAMTKMRGAVELMAPGSLPNDGKVIDDQRSYD
ncbi:phenylacetate--CoA ligase family protein [Rhodovibrionaceae bacterium A322]